jgi:hypothetical protein
METPARETQPGRAELDVLICETAVGALDAICRDEYVSHDSLVRSDEETRVAVQMRGGFTYQISVKLTDWPEKEANP